jgi:hypothetical protein
MDKIKKNTGGKVEDNFLQKGILRSIASLRQDRQEKRRFAVASNMLNLGNLIVRWKDIVGQQLATKTYPSKLIHGRLYLIVSDSQWMQTLAFVKPQILEKLSSVFPKLKVKDIVGKVGVIPAEAQELTQTQPWPDWQQEARPDTSQIKNKELAETIERCYQRSSARIKGLEGMGYQRCKVCKALPTRSENGVCAQCVYNAREAKRVQTMALLADMPWLTYEEASESDHELTMLEFDLIKEQLYEHTEAVIKLCGEELLVGYDEQLYEELAHEITRALILRTGCMPDQVDLTRVTARDLPNVKWMLYLNAAPA